MSAENASNTRSRSSDASAMESATSAPQPDDNAQAVFAAIPSEDSELTQGDRKRKIHI